MKKKKLESNGGFCRQIDTRSGNSRTKPHRGQEGAVLLGQSVLRLEEGQGREETRKGHCNP